LEECLYFVRQTLVNGILSTLNAAGKDLSWLIRSQKCVLNFDEEMRMFLATLEVFGSVPDVNQVLNESPLLA